MPQSKLFTYWNSLEEKDLPLLKDEDGRKFFLDTWKAIKQAEAYSAAGEEGKAHKVMNDRIWAIEHKELPALANMRGEGADAVRAYLAETSALYRASRHDPFHDRTTGSQYAVQGAHQAIDKPQGIITQ